MPTIREFRSTLAGRLWAIGRFLASPVARARLALAGWRCRRAGGCTECLLDLGPCGNARRRAR